MKLKRIESPKLIGTDNGGIAFYAEMQTWFDDVTTAVNALIEDWQTDSQRLAALILKLNKKFPHPEDPWGEVE